MLLCGHAMPMPCCAADVALIMFMNDCLPSPLEYQFLYSQSSLNEDSIPLDRYCRIHEYYWNSEEFKGNFFKSVMCAVYGQTKGLTTFFQSEDNPAKTVLPSHVQAAAFINHINPDDNLAKHHQAQYKDSMPDPLKLRKGTAAYFIEALAADWNDNINKLFAEIAWSDNLDSFRNHIPQDRADIIL